jgi:hypothetical protein
LKGSGIHCDLRLKVKCQSVVETNVIGTANPMVPAMKIIRIPYGGGQKLAHLTW